MAAHVDWVVFLCLLQHLAAVGVVGLAAAPAAVGFGAGAGDFAVGSAADALQVAAVGRTGAAALQWVQVLTATAGAPWGAAGTEQAGAAVSGRYSWPVLPALLVRGGLWAASDCEVDGM